GAVGELDAAAGALDRAADGKLGSGNGNTDANVAGVGGRDVPAAGGPRAKCKLRVGERGDVGPGRERGEDAAGAVARGGVGADGDLDPAGVAVKGAGAEVELHGEEAVQDVDVVGADGAGDGRAAGGRGEERELQVVAAGG